MKVNVTASDNSDNTNLYLWSLFILLNLDFWLGHLHSRIPGYTIIPMHQE